MSFRSTTFIEIHSRDNGSDAFAARASGASDKVLFWQPELQRALARSDLKQAGAGRWWLRALPFQPEGIEIDGAFLAP